VWVITGSGHLVSLNPSNNQMRKHAFPGNGSGDPFGLAPDDDVVGYTDAGRNMVGMLFPKGPSVSPCPSVQCNVTKVCPTKLAFGERADVACGTVCPVGKVIKAQVTTKSDGVFVEAQLDSNANDSISPLGITPNKGKAQGTFFYAVGFQNDLTVDRVGFVRLPMPQKVRHPRDDDDDDDGLGSAQDSPTAHENVNVSDDAPLQGGQSVFYPMTASPTSLALIFVATSVDDPLAQIKVDIYNSLGMLMATSAPTPGVGVATVLLPAADNYTARVTNLGVTANTHTPMSIVREPPEP
jgi:hypothetical protein